MDLILGGGAAQPSGAAAQDLVKDSNTQGFMRDVIDASMTVPVVVDFWSPRSPSCKQVSALLERHVRAAAGRARLVRVNVDENPQLAQQMQVRSVPTAFAVKDGRPLDMLTGAMTEHEIRSFIGAITGNARLDAQVEAMLETARTALTGGDLSQAIALYQQILQVAPGNPGAIAGFLRCNLAAGRVDQARAILGQIPDDLKKHPEIAAVAATLELAAEGAGADPDAAKARLAADPNDHQARFDLAMAAYAMGDAAAAIRELLEIVRRDRAWNDDGARKRLIKILEALGPADPVGKSGRRQLQMMLMV
jgi:putative thioredoxin